MKKVFSWIFGIIFALLALFSLLNSHYVSFLFEGFLAGLLIPTTNAYLRNGLNFNIPKWVIPTAIPLYFIFAVIMGSVNLYNTATPYIQPFIRMGQEIASYDRQPLDGVTEEQRAAVEDFQIEVNELLTKMKSIKHIKREARKRQQLAEYAHEIQELKVPNDMPYEIKTLLLGAKQDISSAFEMFLNVPEKDMDQSLAIEMLNRVVDGFVKVSKASTLAGLDSFSAN